MITAILYLEQENPLIIAMNGTKCKSFSLNQEGKVNTHYQEYLHFYQWTKKHFYLVLQYEF